MRQIRRLLPLLTLACLVPALPACGSNESRIPTALRITKLTGSVVRLGTMDGSPLYGVRLRAELCLGSPREAELLSPDDVEVTHFVVTGSGSTRSWRPARTSIDHPPWQVPFGEGWGGRACGPAQFEDPLPPDHLDAQSLGNPNACYGVELSLALGERQASRRAILRCPALPRTGS